MHCTIPRDIKFSIDQRHYLEDHHEHINFRDDNFRKVTIHRNCFFYSYKLKFCKKRKKMLNLINLVTIGSVFTYVFIVFSCASTTPPASPSSSDSISLFYSPSFLSSFHYIQCKRRKLRIIGNLEAFTSRHLQVTSYSFT